MRNSVHAFAFLSVGRAVCEKKRVKRRPATGCDVTGHVLLSRRLPLPLPPPPLPRLPASPPRPLCLSCPLPSIQVIACTTAILHRSRVLASMHAKLPGGGTFDDDRDTATMGAADKLATRSWGWTLLSRSWKFSEPSRSAWSYGRLTLCGRETQLIIHSVYR